jgi:SAM-dependent methyltransferase
MLVCRHCKTIYTAEPITGRPEEEYEEYYTEDNLTVPDFIRVRAAEIVNELSACRRNNRMLDVGFGSGVILDAAKEQGWQTFGLEVSAPAIEQARGKGYEVFHGTLEEANYPDGYFDLITASEILEHLPDPGKTLIEIKRILRPGGLFWGTTPSATSLSFKLMGIDWSMIVPPEHAQLFSPQAVKEMFRAAGFSDVKIKTHSLSPGEIVHYFKHKNKRAAADGETHDRLKSAYQLNESLMRSPSRLFIKNTLNATLNAFALGDSLKIFATA